MTARPAGPWVVVMGMHRSGTSGVTGALGGLGLQMPRPDDRMSWEKSNPEHWESLSLGLHDEGLLNALGGSWDAPPDLPRHWVHTAAVLTGGRSGAVLAEAYPHPGPSAFKDPRVCLLLPHWRTVLPGPVAALLVWRDPVAVARSLQLRDGLAPASGLALWERYNRAALQNLVGVDTYVARYENIVADPAGSVTAWADWLGSLDPFSSDRATWDVGRAAASIAPELRHQATRSGEDGSALLSTEQRRLADRLHDLDGSHRPFADVDPGEETPWATALLAARQDATRGRWQAVAARQRFWATRARWAEARTEASRAWARASVAAAERDRARDEAAAAQAERDGARARLTQLTQSTSWRATQPLRSWVARAEQWRGRSPGPGPGR